MLSASLPICLATATVVATIIYVTLTLVDHTPLVHGAAEVFVGIRESLGMDRSRLMAFFSQRIGELPIAAPLTLASSESVARALEVMRENSRTSLMVRTKEDNQIVFCDRDVLERCMENDFDWEQPVGNVLGTPLPAVDKQTSLGDAVALMLKHSSARLPVGESGDVVGLIRLNDVLRQFAEFFPEEILNIPPRPHQIVTRREGG